MKSENNKLSDSCRKFMAVRSVLDKTFVKLSKALGYDIELTYVKREDE
jgi:hypothetical protein